MDSDKAKRIKRAAVSAFLAAAMLRGILPDAPAPVVIETSSSTAVIETDAAAETHEEISSGIPGIREFDAQGRLDLNSATQAELETLKGIGPAKAKAIIEYRDAHGGFVSAEEITEVKGIGPGIYSKIKDEIYVSER